MDAVSVSSVACNYKQQKQDLNLYLNVSLPDCLKKCSQQTQKIIIESHQVFENEMQQTLCDSNSENTTEKQELHKMVRQMMSAVEQRTQNQLTLYEQKIAVNILELKNNPKLLIDNNKSVDVDVDVDVEDQKTSSKTIAEALHILSEEQKQLMSMYKRKMQALKRAKNENTRLKSELTNDFNAIAEHFSAIKTHAALSYNLVDLMNANDQKSTILDSMNENLYAIGRTSQQLLFMRNRKNRNTSTDSDTNTNTNTNTQQKQREPQSSKNINCNDVQNVQVLKQQMSDITTVFPL